MKTLAFRKDLNSLRAIAVFSVMLFHFKPNWLSGGFIGVDVFFVISGYLMSSIIFTQLSQQRFNLLNFYIARANRIIPALGVLCFSLLIFAWFFLPPLDYAQLSKHVATSMSFLSNFMYFSEAGYFDSASQEKWLLHTWSLSVEWQFYLIYPLLLLLLHKFFNIDQTKKILLLLLISLFGLNLYLSQIAPSFSYYLLPTRAWEMLLGAFVFLYPLQLKTKTQYRMQYLGLFLILFSSLFLSDALAWPGYAALLPLFGAVLILTANLQHSYFSQNAILQALGRWSYSIYLWHWPLVVMAWYFALPAWWWFFAIALSIVLGALSYRYIEQFKFNTQSNWRQLITNKALWMSLTIAALSTALYFTQGASWHYPKSVVTASLEARNSNPHTCLQDENKDQGQLSTCHIGNPQHIKAVLVGDSHADAVATGLLAAFDQKNEGITVITRASCPFLLHAKSRHNNDTCYKDNFRRIAALKQVQPDTPIVIVSRWHAYLYGQTDPSRVHKDQMGASIYFDEQKYQTEAALLSAFSHHLKSTLCALPAQSKVFITQPIPEMTANVPKKLSRLILHHQPVDQISLSQQNYLHQNAKLRHIIQEAAEACHATVLDPMPLLCKSGQCLAQYKLRPLYYDGDHMSEYGNKFLTPMFAPIKKVL